MINEIVKKDRSYRRFYEDVKVTAERLRGFIDIARVSHSAQNLQPLKYIISNTPEKNNIIFSCLEWGGYLEDWHGPEKSDRPSAYIVVLGDTDITKNFGCDHGIAVQNILSSAVSHGFGGCIIGAIKRDLLRTRLSIPERYEILLVVALGVPKEKVVIEEIKNGNIRYWRDEEGVMHVPKRSLKEILLDL